MIWNNSSEPEEEQQEEEEGINQHGDTNRADWPKDFHSRPLNRKSLSLVGTNHLVLCIL